MSRVRGRLALSEYVDALSLVLFERVGRGLARAFELGKHIRRAGMNVHPVIYASRILLYTTSSALLTSVAVVTLITTTSPTLVVMIAYILAAVMTPLITFSLGITYPSIAASIRKTLVESELPFFLSYLATMARGGVSVDVAIERVSKLRILKYSGEEARKIVRQVKFFADDPLTAIEKVVHEHPSLKFRDLMLGYVATLRAGGDVLHYLETRTREVFALRASEIKMMVDRLISFLELYIVVGVILSLTVFTFFAVSGAIQGVAGTRFAGVAFDTSVAMLYNMVVLPALGVITLLAVHYSQPRTPITSKVPYTLLIMSIPFAILSSLSVIALTNAWDLMAGRVTLGNVSIALTSLTVGMLVASIPPWVGYAIERRGTKGLVRAVSDFLRDLSEVRKTGLSPEKCVVVLAQRSYGNLTHVIRKASTALSLGISFEKALAKALRGVREWFILVVFRFLADSIVVGGGSPEVIDALAIFTQNLAESEEELRRRLRAYVILPYFGAFLVAASPIIIVWQLTQGAPTPPPPESLANLILTLSGGAVVNSYIMGLIAGKVSQMNVAAGFKHSSILTLLTTAVIILTLTYLHII